MAALVGNHTPGSGVAPAASPPVALTLAGSDCSAGAGLQADLKTFSALGVYGLTVPTAVVAEVPGTVAAVLPLPPGLVAQQFDLLLESFPVAAVKTGLLGSREIIEEIAGRLAAFAGPVVIDPVAIASSGHSLVSPDYLAALRGLAARAASLLTPNRMEAEALLGKPIEGPSEAREAARRLAGELCCAVLLKGGHFPGETCTDWLVQEAESEAVAISRARLPLATSLHGTGCTYATAIAAGLARGLPLLEAAERARSFLHRACERAYGWQLTESRVTKALAHEEARVQS